MVSHKNIQQINNILENQYQSLWEIFLFTGTIISTTQQAELGMLLQVFINLYYVYF